MDIPVKTTASGFSLPVYGLGTWGIGGWQQADTTNDKAEIDAIKKALDHGVTHIDTAELYGNGHTEELIGKAIKHHKRSNLIITSKVLAGMQGGYDGVIEACHKSLERLGTDYLDLYLLHRFPPTHIADVMHAMNKLKEDGLIKNIGVSNMTINRMQAAQSHTDHPLVNNQLEYSLEVREAEQYGIINYCQSNDMLVTAWGPLEKGNLDVVVLQDMARKYDKTVYQVALNWLIAQKNIVTIPKTTNVEHLEENLGALGWEMSPEDVAMLSQEYPHQMIRSRRVPLDYLADVEP